jgi:hypothetical protein
MDMAGFNLFSGSAGHRGAPASRVAAAQAGFEGHQHRFCPIGRLHLERHVGDIVADRFRAKSQPLGDLGDRKAAGEQVEDIALAPRQLVECLSGSGGWRVR